MIDGGDRDGSGLDFAMGGEQLVERSEGAAIEFAGHGIGARHIAIDHAQQAERLALLLELLVNAGVVAAEGADSHHGDVDDAGWIQERVLRQPVAAALDCTHESQARVSEICRRSLCYKRVFFRIAICPAW